MELAREGERNQSTEGLAKMKHGCTVDPTMPGTVDESTGLVLTASTTLPSLDDAWEGIMLTYTEQDFPTSQPYQRTIPGWKCRACGQKYGTSGLPPNRCVCGRWWSGYACELDRSLGEGIRGS